MYEKDFAENSVGALCRRRNCPIKFLLTSFMLSKLEASRNQAIFVRRDFCNSITEPKNFLNLWFRTSLCHPPPLQPFGT